MRSWPTEFDMCKWPVGSVGSTKVMLPMARVMREVGYGLMQVGKSTGAIEIKTVEQRVMVVCGLGQ